MKLLLISAFLLVATFATINAQIITSFGGGATGAGSWTYNSGNSTITGTENISDFLFGTPDFSAYTGSSYIQLFANASTAPTGAFTLTLEDNLGQLAVATFIWADFSGGATKVAPLVYTTFNFGNVAAWTLDSGGSGQPINVALASATAVIPEPATWVLMGLSLPVLVVARRRFCKEKGFSSCV